METPAQPEEQMPPSDAPGSMTTERRLTRGRMEAFSDGVFAILITIMVLFLATPANGGWSGLTDHRVVGTLLMYVLSFAFLGIYWNNHHHLLNLVDHVGGAMLWANLHLLFWLSLIPFVTRWVGLYGVHTASVAMYGVVGLMAAAAYYLLQIAIIRLHGPESELKRAIGKDLKGKISPVGYATAIAAAFVTPWISIGLYIAVALMWLIPDRRIEARLRSD